MTWIDDISTYLQTQGIGTLGTDIFVNGFDTTTNCIALFDQPGMGDLTTASDDETIQYPELGVRVRNSVESTAKSKIDAIHALLNGKSNVTIGSTRFIAIEAVCPPFFVSNSATDGWIFSVNYSITI
jgi:hypothetical protein